MLRKSGNKRYFILLGAVIALVAIMALPVSAGSGNGFQRWPVITLDGEDYYWVGPADGPNGARDVPGHYWRQAGPRKFVAKHYNTGPFGASQWWSSDAPDGELLYIAQVIIDGWTPEKAEQYAAMGYVHYHEFVNISTGEHHPTLVGWFKHIARTSFTLDGGPDVPPNVEHAVTPGVDFEFMPQWFVPYDPGD